MPSSIAIKSKVYNLREDVSDKGLAKPYQRRKNPGTVNVLVFIILFCVRKGVMWIQTANCLQHRMTPQLKQVVNKY